MSSSSLSNSQKDSDVFLKCLSNFYQNDFDPNGLNDRKLQLCDSIVKAYNNKFNMQLKSSQLLKILKQNEMSYQPYEWQKMFLDIFNEEIDDTLVHQNGMDITSNGNKLSEIAQTFPEKGNITNASTKSSASAVASIECKPDIPDIEIDYKTMSVYELKRALLISKLEMLEAQEALKIAKENIRLNEEEHLKRNIDKL